MFQSSHSTISGIHCKRNCIVKEIVQCEPYVSSLNTIKVSISTNVPLTRPDKITIAGLVGSMTLDNKALSIFGGASCNCANSCDVVSEVFEPSAQFLRDRGVIVLQILPGKTVKANTTYAVNFQLENPPMSKRHLL